MFFFASLSLFVLGCVFYFSYYNLPDSDGFYYLLSIANPFSFDIFLTFFGFIYHPLYDFFGGSISALRQTNLVVNFFLAAWLSFEFFRLIIEKNFKLKFHFFYRLSLTIAIALSSILPMANRGGLGLLPNYHSLSLQAVFIAIIAALYAKKEGSFISIVGWILLGISCWLAFMGKPTTAVLLFVFMSAYLVLTKNFNLKFWLLATIVFLAFLFASSLYISGSISKFLYEIKKTKLLTQSGGHSITYVIFQPIKGILLFGVLSLILQSKMLSSKNGFISIFIFFGIIGCYFLFYGQNEIGSVESLILKHFSGIANPGAYIGLLLWIIPGFSWGYILTFKKLSEIKYSNWMLAALFFSLTIAVPFGSDGFWVAWSYLGFAGVLASLILLTDVLSYDLFMRVLLGFILLSQLITAFVYFTIFPKQSNEYELSLINLGSTNHSKLFLKKHETNFIKNFMGQFKQYGFTEKTPMIDITGLALTLITYCVKAKSMGFPYLDGNRPYADAVAKIGFDAGSCNQLVKAWIITSSCSQYLSSSVIYSFGGNLEKDYKLTGSFPALGYPERKCLINIFKPIRSINVAELTCLQLRADRRLLLKK